MHSGQETQVRFDEKTQLPLEAALKSQDRGGAKNLKSNVEDVVSKQTASSVTLHVADIFAGCRWNKARQNYETFSRTDRVLLRKEPEVRMTILESLITGNVKQDDSNRFRR